jgi:hypothetical protein
MTPDQWAKGACTAHTNESKGAGVTGISHTTATTGDQISALRTAVAPQPGEKEPNVQELDLNLAAELPDAQRERRARA